MTQSIKRVSDTRIVRVGECEVRRLSEALCTSDRQRTKKQKEKEGIVSFEYIYDEIVLRMREGD
jgi:hypothetical protein